MCVGCLHQRVKAGMKAPQNTIVYSPATAARCTRVGRIYKIDKMAMNAEGGYPVSMRACGSVRLMALLAAVLGMFAGCGKKDDDRTEVVFWHTQSGKRQELLEKVVQGFNNSDASLGKYRVVPQYAGEYSQAYRKLVVNIRAHKPPALAVAYESMVSLYASANLVVDISDYLNHPEYGLTPESQADIFPEFLQAARFKEFDNRMLTFPFTKSILMMYYNKGMLAQAGYDHPPETWNEFLQACRAVKEQTGKIPYALSLDPSTIDAMVYSFGGELLNESETDALFDQAPARKVFSLLRQLADEELCYRVEDGSYEDRVAFINDRVAFFIRSSTSRPAVSQSVESFKREGKPYPDWNLTIIPHAEGCDPVTVLFGANICMFKTSPEVQRGAWEFIKYFVSTDVTAYWATESGYLPVRKSALETDLLQEYLAESPEALEPLQALEHARPEPSIQGWQEVRNHIFDAERMAVSGDEPIDQITAKLDRNADRILAEIHAGAELVVPLWFNVLFVLSLAAVIVAAWRMRRHIST